MNNVDLHEEFISNLYAKVPRRADLVNRVSDILLIEKESASRRLSGRVCFTVREMGMLASELHISLDGLLLKNREYQLMPLFLQSPMRQNSMDIMCDTIDLNLGVMLDICTESAEAGNVYNSLPVEFFMYSPLLTKFMFFKWGYYFVGSGEFRNFSDWKLPRKLACLRQKFEKALSCFDSNFYIWDSSLVWTLSDEIRNFHMMHIITDAERDAIRDELKNVLDRLEDFLERRYIPDMPFIPNMSFYVSTMNMGFTSSYFASAGKFAALMQTNFSYSFIDDNYAGFSKVREWIRSLRSFSMLLSDSGLIERRLFFERQRRIIDTVLG